MAPTLYLPGLAEYDRCKQAFLRSQELLVQEQTPGHREELSDLLKVLDANANAVDFLKAEFGQEYAQVYHRLSEACLPEFSLDEHAAEDGKKKLSTEWYDSWAAVTDGRVMASMGDLYTSFKLLKKMREHGTAQEQAIAQTHLSSLREDFDWPGKNNWLIGGTRLFYSSSSLETRIVQHYKCNRPEIITETVVEVPVYRRVPIEKIVSERNGLAYLQALFDTTDAGENIIQTMEFVSGKNRNNIVGWTANNTTGDTQYTRASHPERAAGFFYYDVQFHVNGNDFGSDPGCSRGVRKKTDSDVKQ